MNIILKVIFIKNILKICFVFIGTIIGAGFASGKEIYSFFCIYGINGLWGILISNFIIGLVIFLTFKIVISNNIRNYKDLIQYCIGNNTVLTYTITNLINIFLLISFIVMVSGFGAYFNQEFNLPIVFGSILISIFAFFTFFKNINGIIKLNMFLIPILIFLIVLLGIKNNFALSIPYTKQNFSNLSWFFKSILYASYNSIALIPIIINMQHFVTKKKNIKYIIFITVSVMMLLSLTVFNVLNSHIHDISNVEIPIVYIANKFGLFYKYIYGIVILIAIFTTATSEGYSLLNNISSNKRQYFIYSILICSLSICFSRIGFGKLLNFLYPILGFLGLLQIGILCIPHNQYK